MNGCSSAALQWGIEHESVAIQAYKIEMGTTVFPCGFFVCTDHLFLGASPDGVVFSKQGEMGLVEIKCPYKHRDSTLEDATTQDKAFHLDATKQLKRSHDYYYPVTGQLAITHAVFCDFVTWTTKDMYIERVYMDSCLWPTMVDKLPAFYRDCLGLEIIHRLFML